MAEELRRAVGLEPGPGRIGISGKYCPHLLQHACLQHRIEARRDPLAQPRALRRELDRCEAPWRWRLLAVLPGAERATRSPPDLPSTHMALAVAGFQPRHDLRVMLGQARAKRVASKAIPVVVGLGAKSGRHVGDLRETLHERAQI